MNGKEFRKAIYKKSNGVSKKIKETTNYYSTDSRLYHIDSFFVIRKPISRSIYGNYLYFADFDINRYLRISAWVHTDSTVEKDFDDADKELKIKTVFLYGNPSHMQPTEVRVLTSKGDTSKKLTKYTDDLRQLYPGNTVLNSMYANNILTTPLTTQSYVNSTLLTTSQIDYNTSLLPFTLQSSKGTNALELEAEYTKYDILGNPQEFKVRGQPSALIVDTTTGLTIAGCQNALFDDIAYTSFETSFGGNWTGINQSQIVTTSQGPTGKNYYTQSNFSFAKSNLSSSKYYTVTYWSNNGSYSVPGTQSGYPKTLNSITVSGVAWTLYEHLVTGQSTITVSSSGTSSIDELRLYPNSARMTTQTYIPLVGISSQCDINNRISYYEYDSFGRLKIIRDQNRNILKLYDYKYASQENL